MDGYIRELTEQNLKAMTWNPENKYMWDFWFAQKEEYLHLFYLQADRSDCSFNDKRKDGLSSVGHAVLSEHGWRDLVGKPVLEAGDYGEWDDLSIWTGSIIEDKKRRQFNMFYTVRCRADAQLWTPLEWQRPQRIGMA